MPQLNFDSAEGLPTELVLRWKTDHLSTDSGELSVRVYGATGERLSAAQGWWHHEMIEAVPDAMRAAMEAYLWGNGASDVGKAVLRARRDAQDRAIVRQLFPC